MAGEVLELPVARKTAATRLPADLVGMANVVASLQGKNAVDVLDDVARGPLTKLYKAELAKAQKAADKKDE